MKAFPRTPKAYKSRVLKTLITTLLTTLSSNVSLDADFSNVEEFETDTVEITLPNGTQFRTLHIARRTIQNRYFGLRKGKPEGDKNGGVNESRSKVPPERRLP